MMSTISGLVWARF